MSKPETIAQLKRKIERLEAQLGPLKDREDHHQAASFRTLSRMVEAETRIKQAMRILTGEDDL